jgi:hypothetical protein
MKKQTGTTIANAVELCRSAVFPRRGGTHLARLSMQKAQQIIPKDSTYAPPETPATIQPAPLFVCLPRPRIPSATMVGKQTDSKKSVNINIANPVFCRCVMEAELKIKTQVRYTRKTYLAFTNLIRNDPVNLPIAKQP